MGKKRKRSEKTGAVVADGATTTPRKPLQKKKKIGNQEKSEQTVDKVVRRSQDHRDEAVMKRMPTPKSDEKKDWAGSSSKKAVDAGILITREEHDAILDALRKVDWKRVLNTSRKNVIPEDAPLTNNRKPYCQSLVMGPNPKDPERKPTFWTTENPLLYDLLMKMMRKYDPQHEFTNITINCNLQCKAHKDRGNSGQSYIIGFGNYSGGGLSVCPRFSESKSNPISLDIHGKLEKFYGGEQWHWTEPFEGERYTCVFYNFPEVHAKGKGLAKSMIYQASSEKEAKFANKLQQFKAKLNKRNNNKR